MEKATASERYTFYGVIFALLVAAGIALLVGLTTHESHMRELQHNKEEVLKCLATDRPTIDCKYLIGYAP